jgi:hypothetical protein
MINPNPECSREDCRFAYGGGSTTLAYYQPIYDKNGVNTNPDRNTTNFGVECFTCGKMWEGKTCAGETTYEELK